jgi:hypothetical protein
MSNKASPAIAPDRADHALPDRRDTIGDFGHDHDFLTVGPADAICGFLVI